MGKSAGAIFGLFFLSIILAMIFVYIIIGANSSWNPMNWWKNGPDQSEGKKKEKNSSVEKFSFCRC